MEAECRQSSGEALDRLLAEIREGSLQAFDRFYERTAPFVMRLSLKMMTDRMEAEDVCHDVLMEVIANPQRYDPARGSVEAWLAVLTRSRCLDRLRKRRRIVLEEGGDRLPEPPGWLTPETERSVLAKLEKEALRRALEELPGLQRQTLAAAYYEDRSQRELAEAWQVPIGTVKSRMRYGLAHLRRTMERLGWAEEEGGSAHGGSGLRRTGRTLD